MQLIVGEPVFWAAMYSRTIQTNGKNTRISSTSLLYDKYVLLYKLRVRIYLFLYTSYYWIIIDNAELSKITRTTPWDCIQANSNKQWCKSSNWYASHSRSTGRIWSLIRSPSPHHMSGFGSRKPALSLGPCTCDKDQMQQVFKSLWWILTCRMFGKYRLPPAACLAR